MGVCGKNDCMIDPRIEDHIVGVELQLVELVERKQRAEVQGRYDDAGVLRAEIAQLQMELAAAAEQIEDEGVDFRAHLAAPTASAYRAA